MSAGRMLRALGRPGLARRAPDWLGRRIGSGGLTLAARHRLPGLAAGFLDSQIRLEKRAEAERPVNLLYLPKPGFTEDVAWSFARDPRFNVFALGREAPKALLAPFFPADIDDNTYALAAAGREEARGRLRGLWRDVWSRAGRARAVDVVVTGNFGYYAEQEMAAALEELGTPFVALHKENLKTPGLVPVYADLYRDRRRPFSGSLIGTYNEIERQIEAESGIFPAERIHVVGMPRLDAVHRWREASAGALSGGRPCVLFMSFNEKTGSPYIGRKRAEGRERLAPELEAVSWSRLVRECHVAMLRLAEANPDLDVVVKAKNNAQSLDALERMFGGPVKLPANLRIVAGGDPMPLIAAADVLCSFNSTTVLEGLAADLPVVVPDFAEAAEPHLVPFVLDLGEGAIKARSAEAMARLLAEAARARSARARRRELDPAARASLRHWLGNDDGAAGRRAADLVHAHAVARRERRA